MVRGWMVWAVFVWITMASCATAHADTVPILFGGYGLFSGKLEVTSPGFNKVDVTFNNAPFSTPPAPPGISMYLNTGNGELTLPNLSGGPFGIVDLNTGAVSAVIHNYVVSGTSTDGNSTFQVHFDMPFSGQLDNLNFTTPTYTATLVMNDVFMNLDAPIFPNGGTTPVELSYTNRRMDLVFTALETIPQPVPEPSSRLMLIVALGFGALPPVRRLLNKGLVSGN